jgi:hypothetical protein
VTPSARASETRVSGRGPVLRPDSIWATRGPAQARVVGEGFPAPPQSPPCRDPSGSRCRVPRVPIFPARRPAAPYLPRMVSQCYVSNDALGTSMPLCHGDPPARVSHRRRRRRAALRRGGRPSTRSDRCAKAPKRLAPSRPREAVDDTDGRQSGGAQRGRTASRPGRDILPTRVAGRSSSRCGTSSSALCTSTSCCRPWSARSTRSSVPQGLSRSLVLRIKSIRKCATPSARVGTGAGPVRFRDGSRCRPRSRRCPSAPSAAGRSSPSSSPAIS